MIKPIRVGVTAALEEVPCCVSWAPSRDSENWDLAYFNLSKDAQEFAGSKAKAGQCVWLCEIGDYTDNDREVRGWFYYWWNTLSSELPLPEKNHGYLSDGEDLIAYRPLNGER